MKYRATHLETRAKESIQTRSCRRHRAARGMTLVEILFALIVLLIGLTAIAAIFPLAAHVQNKAFSEIIADHVARNAEAMIKARGFSLSSLANPDYGPDRFGYNRNHWIEGSTDARASDQSTGVFPVGGEICWWNPDGTGSMDIVPLEERWHLEDRSYPSAIPNPVMREYFWVPLLRDQNATLYHWDLVAYVFVLKGDPNVNYGIGGSVHWNDPASVPKIRQNRLGIYTTQFDGYHSAKLRLGTWGLLQHFPTTVTISDTSPDRGTYAGDVSMIPEALPGRAYQNIDGWFREYHVLSTPIDDTSNHSRRESPLLRIRLVGGEFLRE